ncbi:hypothetical protein [Mucilaginibacter segetis]|uniref:Uncharacterized protein n=1 Tax=Mucilaginibacter segetis TaxID=2793071 RepID=A0A934ULU7_9SPHI|nr:hypothetical protein [Mucilaginibacter segetis]MBK0378202.1 hypothetical protein [Mucilaginibacter segetis]
MKIDRSIIATDNNSFYYDFWPLTSRAWRNFNIEPTIAVIGNVNINPLYGTILNIPEIINIPSGFIAQIIRFIIPCFFPNEVCIIGDIDMVPLSNNYFQKQISNYHDDQIIIYSSDAYKTPQRYPMCYIAAKGKYFQQIIGLDNIDYVSIETFIKNLYALNLKWDTDELFFTKQLCQSTLIKNTIFLKRGGWKPYARRRIDRENWNISKFSLFFNKYIDAHCLRPYNSHYNKLKPLIDYVHLNSNGKRYFYFWLKFPFKTLINKFNLFKQILFGKDRFKIIDQIVRDPCEKTKIISFSLYGNNDRYLLNIDHVLQSYKNYLPDWKLRIYVSNDTKDQIIQLLLNNDCEIFVMNGRGIDFRYSMWRFLSIEDKKAEAIIIRDIDSVCTLREKKMIEEWLISDKNFHIIRDHICHNTYIMGGMWGIKGNTFTIKKMFNQLLLVNKYDCDQEFLSKIMYPLVKDDAMIHDSFPRFPDENPIIIPHDTEGFIGETVTDDVIKNRDRESLKILKRKRISLQKLSF